MTDKITLTPPTNDFVKRYCYY